MSVNILAEQSTINDRKQRISNRFEELKANITELERHLHMRVPSPKLPGHEMQHRSSEYKSYPFHSVLSASPTMTRPSPVQQHLGHYYSGAFAPKLTGTSPDKKRLDWSCSTQLTDNTRTYGSSTRVDVNQDQHSQRVGSFGEWNNQSQSQRTTGVRHTRNFSTNERSIYPEHYLPRKSISPIRQLAYYCEENFAQQASHSRRATHEPTPPGDLLEVCRQRRDWLKQELKIAESKLRIAEATKKAELEVQRVLGPQVDDKSREVSSQFMTKSLPSPWNTAQSGFDCTSSYTDQQPSATSQLRETFSKLTLATAADSASQDRRHTHTDDSESAQLQTQQQTLDRQLLTYEELLADNLRLKRMLVGMDRKGGAACSAK